MKELPIFLFSIIIALILIANIYPQLNTYISVVSKPFDIYMSKGRFILDFVLENREKIEKILKELKDAKKQLIVESKKYVFDIDIPLGIIIYKNDMESLVVTGKNNKDLMNSYVISKDGILIGVVEQVLNNRLVVRNLGWTNLELFAKLMYTDVLVKDSGKGEVLVEIPESEEFEVKNKDVFIETSKSILGMSKILIGKVYAKYEKETYILKLYENKTPFVFVIENEMLR